MAKENSRIVIFFTTHSLLWGYSSSYFCRCIRCMISRQESNTRLIFSVSTAVVKWG